MIDDYRERRSIFTLEDLRQKIYDYIGVVVDINLLADQLRQQIQIAPSEIATKESEGQSFKNIRVVIVEVFARF